MQKTNTAAVFLALGLGMSATMVQAQPRDDHRGPPPHAQAQGRGHYQHDARRPEPRHDRGPDFHRGAGPDHRWVRGYRVPPQYRGPQYVVQDWRGHRLSAPPRGYHWVQYGGDYMLVAIASGVIAQLILGGY
jgi:Ni/Co efflux regulator RcnB